MDSRAAEVVAVAMGRSRNYVVAQALQQYLENNAWQIDRIREGAAAADEGRVRAAALRARLTGPKPRGGDNSILQLSA